MPSNIRRCWGAVYAGRMVEFRCLTWAEYHGVQSTGLHTTSYIARLQTIKLNLTHSLDGASNHGETMLFLIAANGLFYFFMQRCQPFS